MLTVVTFMQLEWQELCVGMSLPYVGRGAAWVLSAFVIVFYYYYYYYFRTYLAPTALVVLV